MTFCQQLGFLKSRAKASCVTQPGLLAGGAVAAPSGAARQASPSTTTSPPPSVLWEMNARDPATGTPGPSGQRAG